MQLEILGNKVGFIWGLPCFTKIAEKRPDLETVQHILWMSQTVDVMSEIAYTAIEIWYKKHKPSEEVPFDLLDFQMWIDEAEQGIADKIRDNFMESKYQGVVMEKHYKELEARIIESQEESSKKKVTRARKSEK